MRREQSAEMNSNKRAWLFWTCAATLLFFRLGTTAAWQSEDRWLEIAREMLLSGHWFRPTLNSQLYFDKPLLSYWLILVAHYVIGALNEWSLRIPSAIAGLITLWATIDLGKQFKHVEIARSAGWILLTCFGFLQWARLGEADMENLAAIALAINWYWRHRASTRCFDYCVFYLIMVIGAQCKGLTAVVVPMLAVIADTTASKRVHINIRHAGAALLGAALYFVPFLLAPDGTGSHREHVPHSGLGLVLRENIVRYVAPFDHTEPFYTYLIALPQYLYPWSIVFLCAMYWVVRTRNEADSARNWLAKTLALLFAFFTLSGSRRNYYILPLLPYCALLCAFYLHKAKPDKILRVTLALLLVNAALLLLIWPLWPQLQHYAQNSLPPELRWHLSLIGIAMLIAAGSQFLTDAPTPVRLRHACLLTAVVFFGGFFFRTQLIFDDFRSEADFARALGRIHRAHPLAEVAVYREKPASALLFYAQLPPTVTMLADREQLNDFLNDKISEKLVLIYHRYDRELPEALQNASPVLEEIQFPWEKNNREKMRAWLLQ